MSMRTYITYGYGISLEKLNPSSLKKFIYDNEKHRMAYSDEELDDMIQNFEEGDLCDALEVISEIIYSRYDVRIDCEPGQADLSSPALILVDSSPWNFTDKERSFTRADYDKIFLEVAGELGLDEEPGSIEVEYCG